jgi:hypothetical protein
MRGAIPPLPQYAFMEWCSVKSTGLYLTSHLCLDLQSGLFQLRYPITVWYIFLMYPMRLILLDLFSFITSIVQSV